MTAETSNARGEWVLVPRELLDEARNIAMEWTVKGRVPECGKFGQIAQDLDAMLAAAPQPPSAPVGVEAQVSALQSVRDRMMAALTPKFGDAFDGDFDVMLEAINTMKRFRMATLAQQPAAVDDLNARRAAFVAERAMRYREGGMAIEQARIHAETDAEIAAIDQARGKGGGEVG